MAKLLSTISVQVVHNLGISRSPLPCGSEVSAHAIVDERETRTLTIIVFHRREHGRVGEMNENSFSDCTSGGKGGYPFLW